MFEYVMSNVPVIVSNLPEMKKVVEDYGIGVVAKENSVEGLIEAIKKATELDKKELQLNINKVQKIYNWEEQEIILLKTYISLYQN